MAELQTQKKELHKSLRKEEGRENLKRVMSNHPLMSRSSSQVALLHCNAHSALLHPSLVDIQGQFLWHFSYFLDHRRRIDTNAQMSFPGKLWLQKPLQ